MWAVRNLLCLALYWVRKKLTRCKRRKLRKTQITLSMLSKDVGTHQALSLQNLLPTHKTTYIQYKNYTIDRVGNEKINLTCNLGCKVGQWSSFKPWDQQWQVAICLGENHAENLDQFSQISMPSDKYNLIMAIAVGYCRFFSQFNVTLAGDVPFYLPQQLQCLHHGSTEPYLCSLCSPFLSPLPHR